MIKAGILSDTHLMGPDTDFRRLVDRCFGDCDIIIHAGDLTGLAILEVFTGKTVHAVHGNMCGHDAYGTLPERLEFTLEGFRFGLIHGAGLGLDIESSLWDVFPEADCVIYGHTHRPACHRTGGRLVINPGSFQATSRYGAPGTYALLEISDRLQAEIHEVPQFP
jgi:putative phosphoesterase